MTTMRKNSNTGTDLTTLTDYNSTRSIYTSIVIYPDIITNVKFTFINYINC